MMPAYLREGGAHRRACLIEIPRAELSKDLACFLGASLFAMLWLGPLCLRCTNAENQQQVSYSCRPCSNSYMMATKALSSLLC